MQIKSNMAIAKLKTVKSKTTAKIKNLTIINVGKDVEKWNSHTLLMGVKITNNHFGKQFRII